MVSENKIGFQFEKSIMETIKTKEAIQGSKESSSYGFHLFRRII